MGDDMDFDLFEALWERVCKMEKYDRETLDKEIDSKEKASSKKEEYITNLEDFIELTCALCPNEEELIRHKGSLLIEEFKKLQ